ncbi:crossover junction endodeoxyribonuclease RuvC [Pseudomonadota bacterium]
MPLRILGIDPGSRITGFGVIEVLQGRAVYVTSGCIRVEGKVLPERLKSIFKSVSQIVEEFQPTEMAIEQVFVNKNIDSALKLGQARGAAICAGVIRDMEVFEYTPTQIKKAIVGKGHADKAQMQFMVRALLNLPGLPQQDAADALACALCHRNNSGFLSRIKEVNA